jgi:hypothetical protein
MEYVQPVPLESQIQALAPAPKKSELSDEAPPFDWLMIGFPDAGATVLT